MENFDLRNFLIENRLTPNSKLISEQVSEVNWKGLAAGAAMTLGTLGVQGQEAPKQPDNVKPQVTWQQMTQAQKAAKKAELVKQGGFEKFKQYKDSISADATNRIEADFAKGAAIKNMSVDQYRKYLAQNAKKADTPLPGLQVGKANKRSSKKGSCLTGQSMGGDSLRDVN